MHQVGTIKSIYRYPVKAMAGEQLASAGLGWHGINGDRRFAFVREGNLSGIPWLTASKMPDLIRYKAYLTGSGDAVSSSVRVRTPEGADVEVESESLRQRLIKAFGAPLALIRVNNGIFDDSPISLISTTTIMGLETDLGCSLDTRRFRPNLLIEPIDNMPVHEHEWVGKTVVLGSSADAPSLRVTIQDIRCVVVNFDPETARPDPRVFRTIARTRKNCLGVYASVMSTGTLTVGDGIYLADN